jgi:hypothetical protein
MLGNPCRFNALPTQKAVLAQEVSQLTAHHASGENCQILVNEKKRVRFNTLGPDPLLSKAQTVLT